MDETLKVALAAAEQRAEVAEAEVEDLEQRSSLAQDITRHLMRSVAMALAPSGVVLDVPDDAEWPGLIDAVAAMRGRAEAAEAEVARLRELLSADRDGYAAGVADGRKAGAGEERDLIVACLRDFERNGPPGLLSGAAQHIEAGCHWPQPLGSIW